LTVVIIWHECETFGLFEAGWNQNTLIYTTCRIGALSKWALRHRSAAVHADALLTLQTSLGVSLNGCQIERFTTEVNDFKIGVYFKLIGFVDEFVFALNLIPYFFVFHA
jgi:hypothetical protein